MVVAVESAPAPYVKREKPVTPDKECEIWFQHLGAELADARKVKYRSRAQAIEELGVAATTLGRYERGEITSLPGYFELAHKLEVDIYAIMSGARFAVMAKRESQDT